MPSVLDGVFVALSTPFDQAGAVDEAALRAHVGFQLRNGVHGVVPCGSTGEFAALSTAERKRVTEIVVDEVAGAVPVIPGTGGRCQMVCVSAGSPTEKEIDCEHDARRDEGRGPGPGRGGPAGRGCPAA